MSCIKVINNMSYKSETQRSTCLTNLKHGDEWSYIKVINHTSYKSETWRSSCLTNLKHGDEQCKWESPAL